MYLRLANKNEEEEEQKIDDEDGTKEEGKFPADRRRVTFRQRKEAAVKYLGQRSRILGRKRGNYQSYTESHCALPV
jgi:hypothetical protein